MNVADRVRQKNSHCQCRYLLSVLITYTVLLDAPSFLSQQLSTILPRISLALRCLTPNSSTAWAVEIEPFPSTYL